MTDKDNVNNSFPTPQEILKMAGENRPVDRSELGIDTQKSSNGLQVINEGFDFLQHGDVDDKRSE